MPALDDRCSLRSLAAGESLAGTASTIRHWVLIEHPGPWGRDGLLDARLPAGLGRELRDLERRTGARVLLIRKPDRFPEYGDHTLICFAVDTREAWLGSAVLDRIEDAAHLDPRERSSFAGDRAGAPLFVVCTHGRRDPCCAERGRPLVEAAAAADREVVWESTHVGGDRFAGNLVAFPHGLYFGRVEPEEVDDLMRAYREGDDRAAPPVPGALVGRLPRPVGRSGRPRSSRPRSDRRRGVGPRHPSRGPGRGRMRHTARALRRRCGAGSPEHRCGSPVTPSPRRRRPPGACERSNAGAEPASARASDR